MKDNFKQIKVNFRDENKRPTSTSLNFNICYFFCECIIRLNGQSKSDIERKVIEITIQKMVNDYSKRLELSKNRIEQELLKDSNRMILEYDKALKNKISKMKQSS